MSVSLETPYEQLARFLLSLLGGAVLAVFYDFFRIKRKIYRTSKAWVRVEDVLFWLVVTISVSLLFYYSNDGELRWFLFSGMIFGVILYNLTLSRILTSIIIAVINIISLVAGKVWNFITYPLRVVCRILLVPAGYAANMSLKIARKSKSRMKRMVDNVWVRWKIAFRAFRKI